MPAATSSPIHPALDHLVDAVDHNRVGAGPLAALAAVPDPRKRRGVRHQISAIVALAVCAVLAGCRSFTAMGEWASDASDQVLSALEIAGCVPCESTIRRTLQRMDGDELDEAIGAWAAGRTEPVGSVRRLIGGGRQTGARLGQRHVRAAAPAGRDRPPRGVVLAQREVGCKTNEITEFAPLLEGMDIAGAVI